ncbi:thioredoxin family protein [Thermococcus sp. P6]|uniref:thioredoxin family protein n=1 Tax=Thermococcus sp. P6 TaxID=122420 RepID=UPI001E479600|nr:thioredoxin family protein [Thermococcus sp. P6]
MHVDAGKWSDLVNRFGVLNVPTLVYLKNGKEVERQNLIRRKEDVEEKLKKLMK